MLNKKSLQASIERKFPFSIDPLKCQWHQLTKTLTVNGEDWEGIIPTNELGISMPHLISDSNQESTPLGIMDLLKEPFQVLALYEQSNGKFLLSHKAYSEACKDAIQVGNIYDATVFSTCPWGAFCNVCDVTVLVHISEFSECKFNDLTKVITPGAQFPVLILSKEKKDDNTTYITASRKKVLTKSPPHVGDIVKVTLNSPVIARDGFYCEITPDRKGIIDIPKKLTNGFTSGSQILGRIKSVSLKGYKLDCIL